MREPDRRMPGVVLAVALVGPGAFSLAYFVFATDAAVARMWYAVAKGFLLLWPLLGWWWLGRRSGVTGGDSGRIAASLAAGVGTGLAIAGLMAGLWASPARALLVEGADGIRDKLLAFGVMRHYLPVALAFSALHAALEEYYWRWFVFGQLRRFCRARRAHLLAAAGFSLHHFVVLGQYFPAPTAVLLGGAVAMGGLIWSVSYDRWGTLWGPWVGHVIVDLAIFWFGWRILTSGGG